LDFRYFFKDGAEDICLQFAGKQNTLFTADQSSAGATETTIF
jgi:hypothetical protein